MAATTLLKAHDDPVYLSLLYPNGLHPDEGALVRGLEHITERAKIAVNNIPTRGGRGPAWCRHDGFSAKEFCALVVMEAWKMLRGELPGIDNDEAHGAINAYWRASGGEWIGEALTGWRRYIQSVQGNQEDAANIFKRVIRDQLTEDYVG